MTFLPSPRPLELKETNMVEGRAGGGGGYNTITPTVLVDMS